MKIIILVLVMIIACAKKNSPSVQEKRDEPITCKNTDTLCRKVTKYIINSTAINFPENFRIRISQDNAIVDTCMKKDPEEIQDLPEQRKLITARGNTYPESKIHLIIDDLGMDCKNNALFYEDAELELKWIDFVNSYYEGKQTFFKLDN